MQEWAAARELFTCRFEVEVRNSPESRAENYVCAYDLSGQFTALTPIRCKSNETLHLTILNGNGRILLDDRKEPIVGEIAAALPRSVKSSDLGMFALQKYREVGKLNQMNIFGLN